MSSSVEMRMADDEMLRIQKQDDLWQRIIKRFCDVTLSALGIIILAPVWLLVALIVHRNMGSVLFRQTRIGYKGRKFRILKFRTMNDNPASEEDPDNSEEEERTTSVGRWIRRLKLDELPQLVNVLVGDMSLIGPRPYIERESKGLSEERFEMRPGLTGLGQVYGNRELSWDERTAYDVEYVRNFSLWLDCKILLRTILVVLLGEKACVRHLYSSGVDKSTTPLPSSNRR